MAALVFIAASLIEQIYRVGCVFVHSRCSIQQCWEFILTERDEFLTRKYLEQLSQQPLPPKMDEDVNNEFEFIEEFRHIDQVDVGQARDKVNSQLIKEAALVYSCSTTGEVLPGTSFNIKGNILRNCERFSVNLTLGLNTEDIALHVNPRLPQNYIVRNCYINGRWGKEEVTSVLPFCLKRGHPFTMQILVTDSEYLISINGQHFAAFRHRLPYSRVMCLQVKGDVVDIKVEQLTVVQYPDRLSDVAETHINVVDVFNEDKERAVWDNKNFLDVPYTARLRQSFNRGTILHIIGRVKTLPHSFYFNLQKGDKIWPHPTIAYHLNQRFAHVGGQHIVCQNSWLDDKWDREERSEIKSGFQPGQNFHLIMMATETTYQIYLNNRLISEYEYRIDPCVVDIIYIQGDLKLKAVILETKPNANYYSFNDL